MKLPAWKEKFKNFIDKALHNGSTPKILTRSFCFGIFIAFSPFPGLHTVIVFVLAYLFNFHLPTLLLVASINNPWTAAPFYMADYFFGHWLLHSVFGTHPTLVVTLPKVFGSGTICLWSFLVGGIVLGLAGALIFWPITKIIFEALAATHRKQKDENYNNK